MRSCSSAQTAPSQASILPAVRRVQIPASRPVPVVLPVSAHESFVSIPCDKMYFANLRIRMSEPVSRHVALRRGTVPLDVSTY